jgi:hypothetical protein
MVRSLQDITGSLGRRADMRRRPRPVAALSAAAVTRALRRHAATDTHETALLQKSCCRERQIEPQHRGNESAAASIPARASAR